jgi:hypothetical protein
MSRLLLPGEKPRKMTDAETMIEQLEKQVKDSEAILSMERLNRIESIKGSGNLHLVLTKQLRSQIEADISRANEGLRRLRTRRPELW